MIGPESRNRAGDWEVEIYNLVRKMENGEETFARNISIGFPNIGNGEAKVPGFNIRALFAVGIFLLAVAGMAIGVIISNRADQRLLWRNRHFAGIAGRIRRVFHVQQSIGSVQGTSGSRRTKTRRPKLKVSD